MKPKAEQAALLIKDLIDNLREHGLIVTVSLKPEPGAPLAMGRYIQVVDVRPTPQARKVAEALATQHADMMAPVMAPTVTVTPGKIEQVTVSMTIKSDPWAAGQNIDTRGIRALEVLADVAERYEPGPDPTLPPRPSTHPHWPETWQQEAANRLVEVDPVTVEKFCEPTQYGMTQGFVDAVRIGLSAISRPPFRTGVFMQAKVLFTEKYLVRQTSYGPAQFINPHKGGMDIEGIGATLRSMYLGD